MPKTAPEAISKEEMERLIRASMDDEFYYLLFNVAKTTGRRLGEYYHVQVKDIDLEKGIMVTRVLKRRKPMEKEAILIKPIMDLIRLYILKNSLNLDDYIFRKVSMRAIQYAVKRYGVRAAINKNIMFHSFRHFFITELVRAGWTYDKIAKLTGHSSVGTLAIYDHAVASDIAEEAREAIRDI